MLDIKTLEGFYHTDSHTEKAPEKPGRGQGSRTAVALRIRHMQMLDLSDKWSVQSVDGHCSGVVVSVWESDP